MDLAVALNEFDDGKNELQKVVGCEEIQLIVKPEKPLKDYESSNSLLLGKIKLFFDCAL